MIKYETNFQSTDMGKIPRDWKIKKLNELGELKNGVNFSRNDFGEGYQVINVTNLFRGRYVTMNNLKEIKKNSIKNPEKYFVEKGDLLFTRSSLKHSGVGQAAMIFKNSATPKLFSGFIIRFRKNLNERINDNFLNYVVRSNCYRRYIQKLISGTTIVNINQQFLSKLPIIFPDYYEQSIIVKILSNIDDKIELNIKMNKTLEEIGKTLFRHWFVDFEFPDENGNPYKSSGGEMIYNEELKKKIPKEWYDGKYSDFVKLTTGKALNRKHFVEKGKFPVIGANGELGRVDEFLFNEELILTGRVGTLGTVYLIRDKVWVSDNVLISKPKTKEFLYYSYYTLRKFNFKALNCGSTQPLVTQTDLKNQTCIIPNQTVLVLFDKILSSFFDKVFNNNLQNNNLSMILDTLLPKLMFGKIRIPLEINQ